MTKVLTFAAALATAAPAWAKPEPVKPTAEWTGSVADDKLAKDAPAAVATKAGLEKLWKAWGLKEADLPKVDFDKEIVVLTTSVGSKVNLTVSKDGDDLKVGGFGTRDLRPGFRYVLGSVPRDGIKTVNGKELPRE